MLLAAVTAVGLYFLTFIAWNWQGGGGFVGNRYFITAIPAFLFLVKEIRPPRLLLAGYVVAGLFLAPLLFTPFGAPVPEPTLQAHVRGLPFRFLPLELSLRNVPGYERVSIDGLRIVGRKDVFAPQGAQMWVGGGTSVELYFIGEHPIPRAVFQVTNFAPGNHVEIRMGKAREVLDFGGEETRRVRLDPGEPFRVRRQKWATFYVYKMVVTSRTGSVKHWVRQYPPNNCPTFVQDDRTNENFFTGVSPRLSGGGRAARRRPLRGAVGEHGGAAAGPGGRGVRGHHPPVQPQPLPLDGGRRRPREPRLSLAGRGGKTDRGGRPAHAHALAGAAGRAGQRAAEGARATGAGELHPGARPGVRDGLLVLAEERRQDAADTDQVLPGTADAR